MRRRLLIVDDEESMRELVARALGDEFEVRRASDPDEGLEVLVDFVPDVLICDIVMGAGGGRRMVEEAFRYLPDLAVVVITGHPDVEGFIEFFRLGVADFLCKPFSLTALSGSVAQAMKTRHLRRENARLREETATPADGDDQMVGESEALARVRQLVATVAPSDSTVLVTGESGTGKELVARLIHATSPRRHGPFVPLHCGAMPEGLIESELFGHARGAFTGAAWPREGCFEVAARGTLFLDEVGTMPEEVQTRLLRVLQERTFCRVGESQEREADVRVVAATNEDLGDLVAQGRFREDLLYRLEVFPISLPRLTERGADVLLLANRFLEEMAHRAHHRGSLPLSAESARSLLAHDWPGNVRELQNVIERASLLANGERIEVGDLLLTPEDVAAGWTLPVEGLDLQAFLERNELALMQEALERTQGEKAAASELLGLPRSTFVRRLKELERRVSGGAAC